MKVFEIQNAFGIENLVPAERPDPVPGPGQVLLEMRTVSLNYRDLLMVQGQYNPRQPLPLVPCSDGVGVVVEVGAGVERVRPGERVMPIFAPGWIAGRPTREGLRATLGGPLDGTLSERMVVDAEALVAVPEHLSDVEAACLPCAGVTAWNALVREARIQAGDRVLVLGTGGVSLFALQIAKLHGAEVFVTSSSDAKLERARELGADHLINYRSTEHWGAHVKRLTGGEGVDVVVEVGGAGTFEQSVRAVRVGGNISLIGVLAGRVQPINLVPVLMQHIRVQGIIVGSREMFEEFTRAVALHELRPVIDQVFDFDDAPRAFEALGQAEHVGKICIRVGG